MSNDILIEYDDILDPMLLKDILGIGRNKVYELLKTQKIRCFRIGSKYRVPKRAVIDYIESQMF